MPNPRVDPYKNFNFRVEIDGITVAGFSDCTGLESEVDVIEYREGGDHSIRKLAGLPRFGDLTLKRGITQSAELQTWHREILNGTIDRRNVVIVLLDDARVDVVRWVVRNAFPRKWEGPHLHASGNEVAIETLVLCCDGIDRDS
jgi:phage tail-like protein